MSPALAANMPPLTPGKPAGVNQAQWDDHSRQILLIAGVAAVGLAIVLATNGNGPSPATSTTSTTP